ncbi:hypothetical protein A3F06_04295 [candidate division TM6 bacterium RIFCSPHIGHO2_12_FULL_36_22]|nr:MAG: hypothetical protein A3F06_04295 [candidate division TM6 bacterium RIFCSPHIGHO2_12_FULL_36_22]
MYLIILLQFILASSFVITKALLSIVPPFLLVGLRMSLGGSILLLYTFIFNRSAFYISKRNIIPLLSAALFGVFITNGLEAWGLQATVSAKAYFIYNLGPFFAALLGYLFFHEKMTRNKWIGLTVGFFGFFPLIFNDLQTQHALLNSLPELALLISSAATIGGWISKKKLIFFQHYAVTMTNGVTMLAGGLCSLVISLFMETYNWSIIANSSLVHMLLPLNILLTCLLGYNLYGWLLKRYSATYTALAGFLGTLFTGLLGLIFLHESVTWEFWVSFIIVAFGVGIFHQEEEKRIRNEN